MFRNSAGCSTHGVAFGFGKGSKCCKNSSVRLSLSLNAGRFLACHAFGVQPVAAGVEAEAVDTLTSGGSASSWTGSSAPPSPSPPAPRNCRGWRSPSSAASSSATRSGSAVGTAPSSAISSSSVRTTCSESGGTVDGTGAAGSSDPPVAGIWTPQGGAQAREVVVEKLASARGVGHDSEATCRVGSAFHPSPLLRAPYRRSDPGV